MCAYYVYQFAKNKKIKIKKNVTTTCGLYLGISLECTQGMNLISCDENWMENVLRKCIILWYFY